MDKNISYNNFLISRYYIICGLLQTIWSLGVLGFTIFLIIFFKNYYVLATLVLIFLKPYITLEMKLKTESNNDIKGKYGSNNPPI